MVVARKVLTGLVHFKVQDFCVVLCIVLRVVLFVELCCTAGCAYQSVARTGLVLGFRLFCCDLLCIMLCVF